MDPKNENCFSSSEASDHEDCPTCSEEESMSEDETPTTSDEEFIVSDDEEEEEIIDELIEDIEDLKKENQVLKNELKKLTQQIWELSLDDDVPRKRKKLSP